MAHDPAAPRFRSACTGAALATAPAVALLGLLAWRLPWLLRPGWLAALPLLPAIALGALFGVRRRALPGAPWLLLGLALAAAAILSRPLPVVRDLRLLVVVIDGATWTAIDPLIDAGELPALARLRREGASAVLRSEEPMHSPRLWTTLATGRPPAEHGVAGFRVRATDVRAARFWDVAEAAGLRIGIYKWLVTYPPREVRGFMVPAWLAAGPETWPPELDFVKSLELGRRLRHRAVRSEVGTPTLALRAATHGARLGTLAEGALWLLREALADPGADERLVALQRLRARLDRDVFFAALTAHRPAVATFGFYATDALSHRFWGAGGSGPDPVGDAYRLADEILAGLLDMAGPEATVVVVSDHGFRARDPLGGSTALAPLTAALEARLARALGPLETVRTGGKLTVTLPADGPPIEALEEAVTGLLDERGQPFFRAERLSAAPRSLGLSVARARLDEAAISAGTVGGEPMADYVGLAPDQRGEHDLDGVFLARGPAVPSGRHLDPLALVDVAPTLQVLLGIPPARDLPGRIALGPDVRGPASRDGVLADHRFVAGAPGVDERALRALGYMD
jgi:hypothetical protein